MLRTLTYEQARTFYDRFGSKQDSQAFYEDPPVEALLRHAALADAQAIVEFGCGTGRLAAHLLEQHLPTSASYRGFDLSSTMVGLAQSRLRTFGDRARVELSDGTALLPLPDASCDRFVSTYVLDLLSDADIASVLNEARRLLRPAGRICLASLTHGNSPTSRMIERIWTWAHSTQPTWVGGCRPLELEPYLRADFELLHHEVVRAAGICTEVAVATPRSPR